MGNPRHMNKPYLILPELVEQPTWGGNYILQLKKWQDKQNLQKMKIGQSYELFGASLLTDSIVDTTDPSFAPSIVDATILDDFVNKNPSEILGKKVFEKYGKMPLLIKLNQARGNSFQLHIKPGQDHPRWKPKPESWYFLEDGYISCGIKKGIDVKVYKQTCVNIEEKMRELSKQVQLGDKNVEIARQEAQNYIKEQNPWQFINLYKTKKYDLIDLSQGGVHHSWEAHDEFPLGNIVYEVQLDVMDEFCTIRSFDQGKIKEDGDIREIHIDDYFTFLDVSEEMNNINNLKRTRKENNLLHTPYYALDVIEITNRQAVKIEDSFNHIYVQEGDIQIQTPNGSVRVTTGHSCFIPHSVASYDITTNVSKSIVLKTYIPFP